MQIFNKGNDIFNILSEAIPEGIVVVNTAQEIVSINNFACDLFGYEPGELIGKPLDVLVPDSSRKGHGQYVSQYYKSAEKRRMAGGRKLNGMRKDRSEFPVEIGLNPFTVAGNTYVLALVIDRHFRKEQNRRESKN